MSPLVPEQDYDRLSKAFRYADLPKDERIAAYFHWIAPDQLESVLSRELREGASGNPSALLLTR